LILEIIARKCATARIIYIAHNCAGDEGRPLGAGLQEQASNRPLGAGLQEQASNHLKLLWLRARVVSVKEKSRLRIVAGMGHGDERKRTTDEVSKKQGRRRNWGSF
jgi:hypothetical protein